MDIVICHIRTKPPVNLVTVPFRQDVKKTILCKMWGVLGSVRLEQLKPL